MKLVHWLVTLPLALVLVVFAISNRADITLNFWPFPLAIAAPIYLVTLLALLLGFLTGELVAWVNGRHWRRAARERKRRIEALERDLAAKEAQLKPAAGKEIALPPRG